MEALDQSDRVLRIAFDILCRPTTLAFLCAIIFSILFLSAILSCFRSFWNGVYWIYSIKSGHLLVFAVSILVAYTGIENSKMFLYSTIEEWEVKERLMEFILRFMP